MAQRHNISLLEKLTRLLRAPFSPPKRSWKKFLWIMAIGIGCSVFILLFNPFEIAAQAGDFYVNFIILSLGLAFALSIVFMEWTIPWLIPRAFKNWNIGKALIWYTIVILFAAGINFLYKSYLGGFSEFTIQEFLFVLVRTLVISFTVASALVGVLQFFNREKLSIISSGAKFEIQFADGKSIKMDLNKILYIASNDNYVDIHYLSGDSQKKLMVRSSLKRVAEQVVNPISPIMRCHRQYLVNVNQFTVLDSHSRGMTISLGNQDVNLPVSSQYVQAINKAMSTRP